MFFNFLVLFREKAIERDTLDSFDENVGIFESLPLRNNLFDWLTKKHFFFFILH